MNFKQSAISAAVAAVLGISSASALPTNANINITISQSGSSAVQPAIQQVWVDFCVPGTLTTYFSSDGASFADYSCTLKSVSPIPAAAQGQNLLYRERMSGGSLNGITPLATNTGIAFLDLSTCGAGAASGTVTCTGTGASTAVPDVGISDVEPKLFSGPNLPAGTPALTASQLSAIKVVPLFQQVFQIAVGSAVSGSVTNITTSQMASIMSGLVTDWHTISNAIPSGTQIAVCLRTPGSGTQAGANALFLNNPCSAAGQASLGTGSNFTFASSTGLLRGCLNGDATSTNANFTIGILGLADPKSGDSYKSVSIDSVAATAANAATGAYKYNVESTLQYSSTLNTTTTKGGLISALSKILSTPSSLATVNSGLTSPAAPAYNAEQSDVANPTFPYSASNPVEWGSRGGSTCAPNILTFPL